MKAIKQSALSLLAAFALAAPSLAADINASVDTARKTLTLTSTLQQAVHVQGLGSSSTYIGMSLDLPAGGSRTVRYRSALPALDFARCIPTNGAKLADRTPSEQGFYDLSLSVQ